MTAIGRDLENKAVTQGAAKSLPKHMPGLDGLRGMAILLVMLMHFTFNFESHTGVSAKVLLFLQQGWVGVDLFFVLSGFLITGILLDANKGEHYFRNFYMRRVLRIFPLYFGVLIAAFLIAPLFVSKFSPAMPGHGKASILSLLLYVSNFYMAIYGTLPTPYFIHFWTLAIEEQFYLFWPAIVWLCTPRTFLGICVGVILGALSIRIFIIYYGFPVSMPAGFSGRATFINFCTFTRADSLAYGAAIAALVRLDRGIARLVKPAIVVMSMTGMLLIAIFFHYHSLNFKFSRFCPIFSYSILGLFFGSLLTLIVSRASKILNLLFEFSALRFLGKYSYGLYVFHVPILVIWPISHINLYVISRTQIPLLGLAAQLFVGVVISIGVAFISYHFYEKHFLKLKRFFEYSRRGQTKIALVGLPNIAHRQEAAVADIHGGKGS